MLDRSIIVIMLYGYLQVLNDCFLADWVYQLSLISTVSFYFASGGEIDK